MTVREPLRDRPPARLPAAGWSAERSGVHPGKHCPTLCGSRQLTWVGDRHNRVIEGLLPDPTEKPMPASLTKPTGAGGRTGAWATASMGEPEVKGVESDQPVGPPLDRKMCAGVAPSEDVVR